MMYLKLNGETIVGHDYNSHGEYNVEIETTILVNSDGNYNYKYVAGKLVSLSAEEVNNHPLNVLKGYQLQEFLTKIAEKQEATTKGVNISKRDQYLKDTDFVMISDAPFTTAERTLYKDYRQWLRDYPLALSEQRIVGDVYSYDEWKTYYEK